MANAGASGAKTTLATNRNVSAHFMMNERITRETLADISFRQKCPQYDVVLCPIFRRPGASGLAN